MTKQVLFVQGGGDGTHDDWDNKLVESLSKELGPGYEIRYPVMPNEANPSYAAWKEVLETEIAALKSGAVLVGHSLGGTILINVLAERAPKRAAAIFLIAAPFVGEGGWTSEDIKPDFAVRLPKGSFSIMAARTRSRLLHMLTCMPKLFPAHMYAACKAAIINSTTI